MSYGLLDSDSEANCSPETVIWLWIVVIAANRVKLVTMLFIPRLKQLTQVTISGGIASCFETLDPATEDICLVGENDFEDIKDPDWKPWDQRPRAFRQVDTVTRWFASFTGHQWRFTLGL